jgi:putative phosphoribosyl transferase
MGAVPTSPESTRGELTRLVDEIVCVPTPEPSGSAGRAYRQFTQVTDQEVHSFMTLENQ